MPRNSHRHVLISKEEQPERGEDDVAGEKSRGAPKRQGKKPKAAAIAKAAKKAAARSAAQTPTSTPTPS
jgi:hypothetical protein